MGSHIDVLVEAQDTSIGDLEKRQRFHMTLFESVPK